VCLGGTKSVGKCGSTSPSVMFVASEESLEGADSRLVFL
jgi:hypothetical protein